MVEPIEDLGSVLSHLSNAKKRAQHAAAAQSMYNYQIAHNNQILINGGGAGGGENAVEKGVVQSIAKEVDGTDNMNDDVSVVTTTSWRKRRLHDAGEGGNDNAGKALLGQHEHGHGQQDTTPLKKQKVVDEQMSSQGLQNRSISTSQGGQVSTKPMSMSTSTSPPSIISTTTAIPSHMNRPTHNVPSSPPVSLPDDIHSPTSKPSVSAPAPAPAQPQPANTTSTTKRRKVGTACIGCQRAHVSCDTQRPCSRCVKRGQGDSCTDAPRKAVIVAAMKAAAAASGCATCPKAKRPLLPMPASSNPAIAPRPLLPCGGGGVSSSSPTSGIVKMESSGSMSPSVSGSPLSGCGVTINRSRMTKSSNVKQQGNQSKSNESTPLSSSSINSGYLPSITNSQNESLSPISTVGTTGTTATNTTTGLATMSTSTYPPTSGLIHHHLTHEPACNKMGIQGTDAAIMAAEVTDALLQGHVQQSQSSSLQPQPAQNEMMNLMDPTRFFPCDAFFEDIADLFGTTSETVHSILRDESGGVDIGMGGGIGMGVGGAGGCGLFGSQFGIGDSALTEWESFGAGSGNGGNVNGAVGNSSGLDDGFGVQVHGGVNLGMGDNDGSDNVGGMTGVGGINDGGARGGNDIGALIGFDVLSEQNCPREDSRLEGCPRVGDQVEKFDYAKSYARLDRYLKAHISRQGQKSIYQSMTTLQPLFQSALSSDTTSSQDGERLLQNVLRDHDTRITDTITATAVWRRTGELLTASQGFSELLGIPKIVLSSGRVLIYELMNEDSCVDYFERFADVGFEVGKGCAAVVSDCVVRDPRVGLGVVADLTGFGLGSGSLTVGGGGSGVNVDGNGVGGGRRDPVSCILTFTVRRDKCGMPVAVEGTFIPVPRAGRMDLSLASLMAGRG
ncbi:hypothetical protein HDU76_012226 [Blyttiomyces sp. JEL0837]|nr:hypothetical protein HDU76_012226 [Blyttiomyces sp. JEL0837]